MSKWEDNSDICEYHEKKIIAEIKAKGKSEILDEILSEYFNKDDIREIYAKEFAEIDAEGD